MTILWYGWWEDCDQPGLQEKDYKNIPNGKISYIRKYDDDTYNVYWDCDYIENTGHFLLIECDKNCKPIYYSIEG